jgi:hypothetical protein
VAWPRGTAVFEGPDWRTIAREGGIETVHELPRLELFGPAREMLGFAEAAAGLIATRQVEYLDLSTREVREDPEDRARKHCLRIHATGLEAREPIWRALWALGARRLRWLLPHWEWDVHRWGIFAGDGADKKTIERVLDVLQGEAGCDRLVFLEEEPREETRALLRGRVEVVSPHALSEDRDCPPRSIETALVSVRSDPLTVENARALLGKTAHRLLVRGPSHDKTGLVLDTSAEPLGDRAVELAKGQRAVISPGDVMKDKTVLFLDPSANFLRWLVMEK